MCLFLDIPFTVTAFLVIYCHCEQNFKWPSFDEIVTSVHQNPLLSLTVICGCQLAYFCTS